MKKLYCTNFFKTLCGMVVMLALVAGITAIPAYAASNGIYTATATPHYRNPLTGKIEDSGGEDSEVLGQSMTESATYTKALVEVDSNGNTYITVTFRTRHLMLTETPFRHLLCRRTTPPILPITE